MNRSIACAVFSSLLALAACGEGAEEGRGGVTAEESQQLNEAAEMLDASPDSLVVTGGTELGNGEEPADAGELPVVSEDAVEQQ